MPFQREFGKAALSAKSGVVDEHVDLEPMVLELPEDLGGGFGSGQIRDHNPCIDPVVFAEFPGQRFQRAATTGHQHETTAVGGEALGTRVRASNAVKEVAQPEGIH